MGEERQAATLIGLVFLIGLVGLLLTGGVPDSGQSFLSDLFLGDFYVESYRADVYLNATLDEHFVYSISSSGKYRMLYRSWKIPLSQQKQNSPYVSLLNVSPPQGTVPYMKDNVGTVTPLSGQAKNHKTEIAALAENNEAGCFQPQMFPAGKHPIGYLFQIHPFLECDQEFCHWNLRLADEHLPYRKFTITIHDPDSLMVSLYPHPKMEYRREGDAWIITGSSPKNDLLEVEMLLKPEASNRIPGFPHQVSNVGAKTLSAQSSGPDVLPFLQWLLVLFPFLIALIYYRFGKEKRYVVPRFLSTIPSKRKPWLVNMVFKGDCYDFDPDGFYATLPDMDRRGIIKIETTNGTKIILLDSRADDIDGYERKVLTFSRRTPGREASFQFKVLR
jgi:uncharacterized membrane protein